MPVQRAGGVAGTSTPPTPTLRGLGVDTRSLAVPRRSNRRPRTTVLSCSAVALHAAGHVLTGRTPDVDALAEVVESDPMFVLRVLHLANQLTARGHTADTVPAALTVLGRDRFGWLLGDLRHDAARRPIAGVWRALARGLAAEVLSGGDREAFTAGLLTGLADALGVPVPLVLEVSGVSREMVAAVTTGAGSWARGLHAAIAFERHSSAGARRSGLELVDVYDICQRATSEAKATARALGSR
ncbi:hypothetical protein [Actinotalea lenta]|uniref:hypothetical protein n=1 Tax=Actinotalea lenta TaxID=3064654 RepID=UPI00272C52B2|nr:hypothetical protein [Isoptericola sp. b490]